MIYFLQKHGDVGSLIKIGLTFGNPYRRMLEIQDECGIGLCLLGVIPGHYAQERELHTLFAEDRIAGEWFAPIPDLLRFIEQHAERMEPHEIEKIARINAGRAVSIREAEGKKAFKNRCIT